MYNSIRKRLDKYPKKELILKGSQGLTAPELDNSWSLANRVQSGVATEAEKARYLALMEQESETMEEASNWSQDIQTTADSINNNATLSADMVSNARMKEQAQDIANLNNAGKTNSKQFKALGFEKSMSDGINGSKISGNMLANVGVKALNVVDELTMGDKNFGAQSAAIDSAVHGLSGSLMKSGNPYAVAAGAALEGANFLTKAGGQTVQGFDVNIENSGYGNIGHMDSSSSRDFGAMIGLGGLNQAKMQRKLQNRNEQAQMALKAANVSDITKFEQEARMNSVDDVLRANSIALAGGIDTNLLGA